mmetsp:Transcript_27962/g.79041  ORF Transcript_27962/g.79041 Transcript_27962/m.79041 type:complete len:107 (-) Transcript_27962:157-477(-)
MGGKAKPTKHTAKELNEKAANALTNKGGGADGKKDRQGGSAGHAKLSCPVCAMACPSATTAKIHWDAKHDKLGDFIVDAWTDKHAESGGVTTQGVAVRGGIKKHHN